MSIRINRIYKLSEFFYKEAGLLKFPEELYNKICNFVISKYCDGVRALIIDNKKGAEDYYNVRSMLDNESQNWKEIMHNINGYLSSEKSEEDLDQLVYLLGGDVKSLPEFRQKTQPNPLIHQGGFVDFDGDACVMFYLAKNELGNYKLKIKINHISYNDRLVKFEFINNNCNVNKVNDKLNEFRNIITTILLDFSKFIRAYNEGGVLPLTKIPSMMRVLNSNIKDTSRSYEKEIFFNTSELPYSEKLPNQKEISIHVTMHPTQSSADAVYKPERGYWAGLWSPVSKEHQTDILGFLDIYADVRYGASLPGAKELSQEILRIKEVVRHELQHAVQTYGKTLLNFTMGYPSGSKSTGNTVNFDDLKEHDLWNEGEKGDIAHSLEGIEFYTRLSDEIAGFNSSKSFIPKQLQRDYMLTWICAIPSQEFVDKLNDYIEKKVKRFVDKNPDDMFANEDEHNRLYNKNILNSVKKINNTNKDYANFLNDRDEAELSQEELSELNKIDKTFGRPFFNFLKKYKPNRYKKAVKEFIKAIS